MKAGSFGALRARNAKYNAFTLLRKPRALFSEEKGDVETSGPLFGKTTALKDLFCTKNEPTTCSSRMLANFVAPYDATVATLLETAGAEVVGKTNMDEFGMGNSTTKSWFGPTTNPVYAKEGDADVVVEYEDHEQYLVPKTINKKVPSHQRIVGGSSGGSACSVAAGMVDFAIGSDTGGSVRLPAAYTGVYGFKPTYGRISRWGMVAYAQSLDTVGVFAQNVGDIWQVVGVLDVYDSKDPTSLSEELREETSAEWMRQTWVESRKSMRVGVPEEFVLDNMAPEVKNKWVDLLEHIRSKGHEVVPVSVPTIQHSLAAYYTLATAEAASNLARYDGNRYGFKEGSFVETRSAAFGEEVKRRITLGNYTLSSYGYESHYMKAMNVRSQLVTELNAVLRDPHVLTKTSPAENGVDFLVSPTAIAQPPTVEEFLSTTAVESYTNDVLTVPASLAGLPALNLPYQNHGFQIMGQHGFDYKVLKFARDLDL